jgi:hypothetical protein
MFAKNEGPVDRTIRVVAGFALIAVGLFVLRGVEASVAGIVVAAFGGWLVATGTIGVCLLYLPLGISTLGTTHGPFGIRLRTTHSPTARSSDSEVPVVRRSRQDALR